MSVTHSEECVPQGDFPTHWHGEPLSDELIRRTIGQFRWFAVCDFGNGIVARPPYWPDAPVDSPSTGVAKFEFLVRGNLPDLQGKRVLDIGCNAGVIAVHLARLGAAEVVGVDQDAPEVGKCSNGWNRWREQAEFTKAALEWRCRRTYNVRYVECDMRRLPELDLGRFDIVLALNCLYYLEPEEMARLVRHVASITSLFVVQCNTRDHRRAPVGARSTPKFIRGLLLANGFPKVRIAGAWLFRCKGLLPYRYERPVVVGEK